MRRDARWTPNQFGDETETGVGLQTEIWKQMRMRIAGLAPDGDEGADEDKDCWLG